MLSSLSVPAHRSLLSVIKGSKENGGRAHYKMVCAKNTSKEEEEMTCWRKFCKEGDFPVNSK